MATTDPIGAANSIRLTGECQMSTLVGGTQMRAKNRDGKVVVFFTATEAQRLGITSANVAATVATPAPKTTRNIVCTTIGCYKFEHAFSQAGAYGTSTAKGHFDLNPSHTPKVI